MRYTLVVNLDRCSGCDSCITACKYAHNLPLGAFYNRIQSVERGAFPHPTQYWLPRACQQCENAACQQVCPTGATYRDSETNAVLVRREECIGCGLCVTACPYGARSLNEAAGIAWKCDLCDCATAGSGKGDAAVDGARAGEDRSVPVCVHNCPCGARFFGDIDDPESDATRELARYGAEAVHTLPDPSGAAPTTHYILSPSVAAWAEDVL